MEYVIQTTPKLLTTLTNSLGKNANECIRVVSQRPRLVSRLIEGTYSVSDSYCTVSHRFVSTSFRPRHLVHTFRDVGVVCRSSTTVETEGYQKLVARLGVSLLNVSCTHISERVHFNPSMIKHSFTTKRPNVVVR